VLHPADKHGSKEIMNDKDLETKQK
jgi:hypothetical protein